MNYEEALQAVMLKVDEVLTQAPLIIRNYTTHLSGSKGKFIRAKALLISAMDKDDSIHPDGIQYGAAIELLHLATLVHDDVIDEADTRRGIMTLHKKYDKKTAVICGDYLLCEALKTAAKTEKKDLEVTNYASMVCLGEIRQHVNSGNLNLSVYDYFRIIRGKTAALFEASFFGGAILLTEDQKIINQYAKLGRYIGMIFQLTDDCIDFEMDEDVAKKPVQSDYEQGVITLPLIYSLEREPEFKKKATKEKISRKELNQVVFQVGGIKYTKDISKKYYKKSLRIVNALEISDLKREKITQILDKAYYGLKK